MSRSYRRPYFKDAAHWRKKLHSRAFRRMCRQHIREWAQNRYGDLDFKHRYQITNPYDICDWSWYAPENPKAYRK